MPAASGGAAFAAPVHVDDVVARDESLRLGDALEGPVEIALGGGGERHVEHDSAGLADQVVVVPGEFLGELVMSVIPAMDQPTHHTGVLHQRQVPIRRALCEIGLDLQEFRQGDRSTRTAQTRHDLATSGRVAKVVPRQSLGDGAVEFGGDSHLDGQPMSNTTIAIIAFVVAVACSFICAYVAQKKGRSVVGFAIVGLLVPLIGLIVIAVLKPVPPSVET